MKQQPQATRSDAVAYLRVSSLGQVETDFDPEGISLPAQRKAITTRAKELGAVIVNEFTDPGKSAKSIEHRAAFREMIAYLKANRNVRYVIVYALSRFARNRYDDAIMMMTLEKLGVTLISTTEKNLDESPAGRAMHGMIAVFNEYQVLVSGEDIKYKMGQKAKNGGTLGVAKIGYKNVRITYEGREVRAIDIDPERAPFVTMAFELYATGNYSFHELRNALTDAGLRTKGNRRYGPRAISLHSLGTMLRDRYYLGFVTYDGIEYPGRHKALIDPDLFERVQKVLYTERNAGTRERVHDHYLKGTIWCARCHRRLILRPSTSKTGQRYFYYICRGVQEGDCDLPALPLHKVEHAVTQHYNHISISEQHRKTLKTLAAAAADDSKETTAKLRSSLRAQLTELDRQEDRFLDLIGDPEWPQDKIKARLQKVREGKQRITHQLEGAMDDLEPGRAVLLAALELLDRPRDLYHTATDEARKMLNKAIFTRLYLDSTDRQPTATAATLSEPFASLVHATRATGHTNKPSTLAADEITPKPLGELLTTALAGQSASKAAMVELRGIEPLTFSMRTPGTAVNRGCFRSSRAAGGCLGAVLVSLVAVLRCCTAEDRTRAGTSCARAARTRHGTWCRAG
ncbi:MAG: recombinase family protein [Pseudonocardiales bacterium]|nr:recombinase family protein [Pseudonocardiales bacterium]MBV9164358.1 recombinase family protein [Pseudonocardiales bacterium]